MPNIKPLWTFSPAANWIRRHQRVSMNVNTATRRRARELPLVITPSMERIQGLSSRWMTNTCMPPAWDLQLCHEQAHELTALSDAEDRHKNTFRPADGFRPPRCNIHAATGSICATFHQSPCSADLKRNQASGFTFKVTCAICEAKLLSWTTVSHSQTLFACAAFWRFDSN